MKALLVAAALLLAGCVEAPTAGELAAADYGPYPTDYDKIVRAYMETTLFDADSAKYKWDPSGPKKSYFGYHEGFNNMIRYCYRLNGEINAKNQMGGYVGYHPVTLWIRDGEVVKYLDGEAAPD